ncbi:uncharacterized protein LOC132278269 [Cornus florida]|uniref:uncharacterized protein LOC132278269 n=1 Tax=Cornus florida TaxID=4283 RepID=UPI00289F5525|nr:uncharacterized protein LOC132278269 [Cornus florida]
MSPPSKISKTKDSLKKLRKQSKRWFKPCCKRTELPSEALPPKFEDDDVPSFPRGGGYSRSRNEVSTKVDAEFEAEERESKKKKKNRVKNVSHSTKDDFESLCSGGITAKKITLKVDVDRSYFSDDTGIYAASSQGSDDAIEKNSFTMATEFLMNLGFESENREHLIPTEVEARASVLPLAVPLDDTENSELENVDRRDIENVDDADTMDEKNKRCAKEKARKRSNIVIYFGSLSVN